MSSEKKYFSMCAFMLHELFGDELSFEYKMIMCLVAIQWILQPLFIEVKNMISPHFCAESSNAAL